MSSRVQNMTVLLADPSFAEKVPRAPHVSVLTPQTIGRFDITQPRQKNLFVVSTATNLNPVAELVHEASSIHKLRGLFVRTNIDCNWSVPMLERAGIRSLRNTVLFSSESVPSRILRAWSWGAQNDLIADALVFDSRILVRDCALNSYEVSFESLPALETVAVSARQSFIIDSDGSFLHWPEADIHLSLDEIRYSSDPAFRKRTDARRLGSQKRFGAAVRHLRTSAGLRQSDITGLSPKQIARIEAGLSSPRMQTFEKLAAAHSMALDDYLSAIADLL